MADSKYNPADLKKMQSWDFYHKIGVTQTRITEWYEHYGGKVSCSFSGGADSSVLLWLARRCYPDIEAVFAHTHTELPSQVAFIKSIDNVTFLRPKKEFGEVVKEYGWCFPNKETAITLYYAKRGSKWALDRLDGVNKDGSPSPYRKSRYGKWKFLLDSEHKFAPHCCRFLKELPLDEHAKATGKHPIIGTLAEESRRRTESWLRVGCNAFDKAKPSSQPMSFWTKSDVFRAIAEFDIPYCKEIYGEVVENKGVFSCTGSNRSGCSACIVGCYMDSPNKIQLLKDTNPNMHKYVIETLGLGEFLDFVGVDYGKDEP